MVSASYFFFVFYYVQNSEGSQYFSEIYRQHKIFFWIEDFPLIPTPDEFATFFP
jgi:hypothetical protein